MKTDQHHKHESADSESLQLHIKELSELTSELLSALKFTRDSIQAMGTSHVTDLAAKQELQAFQNSPKMAEIDEVIAKAEKR